ncbi:ATP-dependent RNA helicase mak5 [Entamoeba marina]
MDDSQQQQVYHTTRKWSKLYKFDFRILQALCDLNFTIPTEIQQHSIRHALHDHKDIVGSAPTGSGKTISFLLPIIQRLIETDKASNTQCIVIVPTRELAVQIKKHYEDLTKYLPRFTCAVVVGGMSIPKQVRLLKQEPTVVIATPGRLFELYNATEHNVLQNLPEISYVVVDEADRLLEKGHFKEVKSLLELFNNPSKQSFVFSATLVLSASNVAHKHSTGSDEELSDMLNGLHLLNPSLIDVSTPQQTVSTITENKIVIPSLLRDEAVFSVLKKLSLGKTIIFVNAITMVKRLIPLLQLCGIKASGLYGGMEMPQRLKNIEKFTGSPDTVLVTTDVAARGIDIPDINTVIHYDLPRTTEIYVHRSGRTARAGRSGKCIVLVEKENKKSYEAILRSLKKEDFASIHLDAKAFNLSKQILIIARKICKFGSDKKKITGDKAMKKEFEDDSEDEEEEGIEENEEERVERQMQEKKEKYQNSKDKEELKRLLHMYQMDKITTTNKGDFMIGMQLKQAKTNLPQFKGKSKRNEKRQRFVSVKNLGVDDIEEQLKFIRSLKK